MVIVKKNFNLEQLTICEKKETMLNETTEAITKKKCQQQHQQQSTTLAKQQQKQQQKQRDNSESHFSRRCGHLEQ
jgi:hypothetical protein